jgi:hypothetical protein
MKRRVQQVVEEAFERCKVEYGLFPMGVTEEALKALKKRPPLVEVYNILRIFFHWSYANIRPLPFNSFLVDITCLIAAIIFNPSIFSLSRNHLISKS